MEFQEHVALAPYTTLRIGGPARFFAQAANVHDLVEGIAFARKHGLRLFMLGGGSNLLVPDKGFPGLVLHVAFPQQIVRTDVHDGSLFDVSAGTDWDTLVRTVCEQYLCGMECLAGIPGLTGGAPIQNIGAYGQDTAQTLEQVTALDLETLQEVVLSRAECGFSYRHSIFNSSRKGRYIIASVRFRLLAGTKPNLDYADLAPLRGTDPRPLDVYHFVRSIRDKKGMLIDPERPDPDTRSAGSFFKNPVAPASSLNRIADALKIAVTDVKHWPLPGGEVKLPAAGLIERAGFAKGFALGPAAISSRHTLALTNRSGDATCADLLALRDLIVSTVQREFSLTLEQEPVLLA